MAQADTLLESGEAVAEYPMVELGGEQDHGETQDKRGISYYRSPAKQAGRRIYLSTNKAGAGLLDVLKRLTISRGRAAELR